MKKRIFVPLICFLIVLVIILSCVLVTIFKFSLKIDVKINKTDITPITLQEKSNATIMKELTTVNSNDGEFKINITINNIIDKTKQNDIIFLVDTKSSLKNDDRLINFKANTNELANKIIDTIPNSRIGIATYNLEPSEKLSLTNDKKLINDSINNLEYDTEDYSDLSLGIQTVKGMLDSTLNNDNVNKVIVLLTYNSPTKIPDNNEDQSIEKISTITKEKLTMFDATTSFFVVNIDNSDTLLDTIFNGFNSTSYNIRNSEIEETFLNQLFEGIFNSISTNIDNLTINEILSDDTIKYFDIVSIDTPNIGKISNNINSTTKNIEWKIDKLKRDENAILTYILKAKNMKDRDLLNKEIYLSKTDILEKEFKKMSFELTPIIKFVKK